jgi:hypothetical protein
MLALNNVRKMIGIHRARFLVTGAAPISPELVRWYLALGLPMLEVWGMTETCGAATGVPADRIKPGSIGPAAEYNEMRLDPVTGEITGTPTVPQAATNVTITATTPMFVRTTIFTITVIDPNAPAPAPAPAPSGSGASTGSGSSSSEVPVSSPTITIPEPTPAAMAGFKSKKCNNASTRDGNCIPICVPIKDGKVVGPPTELYGGKFNTLGADGKPFDMGTANYFYERPVGESGSGGEYYPITDASVSRVKYGSDTDCTQDYLCSASGLPGSDGSKSSCNPAPPKKPCDPTCTKVLNPFFAKSACIYNKDSGYTCYPCPMVNGELVCNGYADKCGGCGSELMNTFPADWQPEGRTGPSEKPYTPTECQANCKKPGIEIFQKYLNTFRDGSGFDDGSCQIIGRNMVKCRPVNKSSGVGGTGDMKPISAPDECVLCDEPGLQGYATFNRKWDDYAKQNDYVDVKLVDAPRRGGSGSGSGSGSGRGASYGPSDGSRGGGGCGGRGSGGRSRGSGENWGKWDGGSGSSGGWRGNRGSDGWYQSLSDVKNKSFQVAALNAESSQQQAYIEMLKLELNKLNDDYTTQQTELNKIKANIDKMTTTCQNAKSKLIDAKRSSVSDNMNSNSAITLKQKLDANTNANNIALLNQNVKDSCDKASQISYSYNNALKQLAATDAKRQALIQKLVVAMNSVTDNKTTININLGGGVGMGDCGDRLGCGTGIQYNNMYTNDYFKPQRIDDMINNVNVPMPYQDLILF